MNDRTVENRRIIAYSMDILRPGFYFWFWDVTFRLGGCKPDDQPYRYNGELHSFLGAAIVLPGYRIFSTYRGLYDPYDPEGEKVLERLLEGSESNPKTDHQDTKEYWIGNELDWGKPMGREIW